MILPQTYGVVLILMALSLLCWGSWANTLKLAGKHRFEIYYVDFAIGCLAVALIYAFTVGSTGYDGFSFLDDMSNAGKRQWLFGFLAGVIFNLGNMLLTASISVAGMTVAFPVGIGMAIIMTSLLGFIVKPASNLMLLLAGCALIAAAIVVIANAYNIMGVLRHEELARAGKTRSTRRPTTVKGVVLALVGGLLLGSFFPLMLKATETEIGLGPYAVMVVFAIGVFLSTLVFDIFLINLPVEGDPLEISDFFRVGPGLHFLGVLGGAIWCTGSVASLTTGLAPVQARLPAPLNSLLSQGYPLIAVLWGLLAWKEFRRGDARVKLLTLTMFVLFAGGLALLAIAPLSALRS